MEVVDEQEFHKKPRSYALSLIEDDLASNRGLLLACLDAMSHEDVRAMLDNNEMSPRFFNGESEDN